MFLSERLYFGLVATIVIDTPIDTGEGGVVLHIPGKRVVRLVFSQIGLRNCPNRVAERESADQAFLL